jgi:hypothetical protein
MEGISGSSSHRPALREILTCSMLPTAPDDFDPDQVHAVAAAIGVDATPAGTVSRPGLTLVN